MQPILPLHLVIPGETCQEIWKVFVHN